MRRTSVASLLATVLTASFTPPAFAWNGEAHQLVAWIAEARLSKQAKAGVQELLGDAELSDAEVVSWADSQSSTNRSRRRACDWRRR